MTFPQCFRAGLMLVRTSLLAFVLLLTLPLAYAQTQNPPNSDDATKAKANSLLQQAQAAYGQGRFQEASDLMSQAGQLMQPVLERQLREARKTAPTSETTAEILEKLGESSLFLGHWAETVSSLKEALRIRAIASPTDNASQADDFFSLGSALFFEGQYREAEGAFRQAAQVAPRGSDLSMLARLELGADLTILGKPEEGQANLRDAWVIAQSSPNPQLAITITSYYLMFLAAEGQTAEARQIVDDMIAAAADLSKGGKAVDAGKVGLLKLFLGIVDFYDHDYRGAEQAFSAALQVFPEIRPYLEIPLALLHARQGRAAEAIPLLRAATKIPASQTAAGMLLTTTRDSAFAALAIALEQSGQIAESELAARHWLALVGKLSFLNFNGSSYAKSAWQPAMQELSRTLRLGGHYGEALSAARTACDLLATATTSVQRTAAMLVQSERTYAASCDLDAALADWAYAQHGPGTRSPFAEGAPPDAGAPELRAKDTSDVSLHLEDGGNTRRLLEEAFERAQRANRSDAAEALARRAAREAPAPEGARVLEHAYEDALARRDGLEQQFSQGQQTLVQAQALSDQITGADQEIAEDARKLQRQWPAYWEYRSPSSVTLDELRAPGSTKLRELLHSDEALILWMYAPGHDKGLVFAVSKEHFDWAEMGMDGIALRGNIQCLRLEIDPLGYRARSEEEVPTSKDCSANPTGQAFQRQIAYELHQALLADPHIQNVIKDKHTLLIVPSGPLMSLPPSLLVVEPPTGDDNSPADLRTTHWLIEDKAIAVLPAVASLKALRQLFPTDRGPATDPLLELADPDFGGTSTANAKNDEPAPDDAECNKPRSASVRGPTAKAAFANGQPREEVLANLPRLRCTYIEGAKLRDLLGGGETSLLTRGGASRTALDRKGKDLEKVKVLGFATHGLITGDFVGLAEPALALAHPSADANPDDKGVLQASDAATLKLHADWVILSACNTASPDAPEAQGLSGLARAFFYAGARSLLVSHWRIDDLAAATIVTETMRLLQPGQLPQFHESKHLALNRVPVTTKPEALRIAMLELMENPKNDASGKDSQPPFATPTEWAPFVVIGDTR